MSYKKINKWYFEYNNIIKENDEIYRSAAKKLGLPECAFWILYFLRMGDAAVTQSEICDSLYQPKQTVNSALKKLEADGFIELQSADDRRSKEIRLTEKGMALAGRTADQVIEAEHSALLALPEEEREIFLRLFRTYTDLLRQQMKTVDGRQEADDEHTLI